MTPEAQCVAIAEVCGYQIELDPDGYFYTLYSPIGKKLYGSNRIENLSSGCPDYTGDLNAMHEAESYLATIVDTHGDLSEEYEKNLIEIGRLRGWPVWYSTAAQRAEAFLKTLNLWES